MRECVNLSKGSMVRLQLKQIRVPLLSAGAAGRY